MSLLTLLVNALALPPQTGVMVFGGLALLALSWRPDGKLHVHALNVEGCIFPIPPIHLASPSV